MDWNLLWQVPLMLFLVLAVFVVLLLVGSAFIDGIRSSLRGSSLDLPKDRLKPKDGRPKINILTEFPKTRAYKRDSRGRFISKDSSF